MQEEMPKNYDKQDFDESKKTFQEPEKSKHYSKDPAINKCFKIVLGENEFKKIIIDNEREPNDEEKILIEKCKGNKDFIYNEEKFALLVFQTEDHNNLNNLWSQSQCEGDSYEKFSYLPMKFEAISIVTPIGGAHGAHITPKNHGGITTTEEAAKNNEKIYAVSDGTIVKVERRASLLSDEHVSGTEHLDHRMIIEVSCNLYYLYDHIFELDESVKEQIEKNLQGEGNMKMFSGRIKVKAGQQLGSPNEKMNSFDFAVYDLTIKLPGFINYESYLVEPWKIHTADFTTYFNDSVRTKILEKNLRKVFPYGGKIDYDIKDKAIGNWFLEGTNGYAGKQVQQGRYWSGHLALYYDFIEPKKLRVSIGDVNGKSRHFGIEEGSIDFSEVGKETGPVPYELFNLKKCEENNPLDSSDVTCNEGFTGTLLIEHLGDQKLKVEIFLDEKLIDKQFTEKARIYIR